MRDEPGYFTVTRVDDTCAFCLTCGAVVIRFDLHNAWHQMLATK